MKTSSLLLLGACSSTASPEPVDAKILIAGVAYKRDIDDMRESPALDIMGLLHAKGALVSYADPFVPEVHGREWSGRFDIKAVEMTRSSLAEYDAVRSARPDGRTIAFVVNDAGISRLHLLDVATRKYAPVAGLVDGVTASLQWHQNSREVGFTLASAPSSLVTWTLGGLTSSVTQER